jgi:acetoin utilization deacetylase AcuC-like enzyme
VHSTDYIELVEAMSMDTSKGIHRVGDESAFMPGGYDIAALAAGGALTATDAVLEGRLTNAYVLSRRAAVGHVCGAPRTHCCCRAACGASPLSAPLQRVFVFPSVCVLCVSTAAARPRNNTATTPHHRPPGHHATRSTGGGYCIFNNVAVAAAHALTHHQLQRVAIVDFDVHHGNGTQVCVCVCVV